MQAGNAGNRGHHHAGKKLHGCHVALIKSARRGRQHFENTEGAAIVTQRGNENRADSKATATGQIDARVALRIVTKHDLAGADGFCGNTRIGLEANPEIGSGTSGAGATNDFVAGAAGDGGSGGTSKMLGALGDGADGRFQILFSGMNFHFIGRRDGSEAGHGMCAIGDAKLGANRQGRHARVVGQADYFRIGDGAEQVTHQIIELNVGDEMRGLLVAHRSSENA